MTGLARR